MVIFPLFLLSGLTASAQGELEPASFSEHPVTSVVPDILNIVKPLKGPSGLQLIQCAFLTDGFYISILGSVSQPLSSGLQSFSLLFLFFGLHMEATPQASAWDAKVWQKTISKLSIVGSYLEFRTWFATETMLEVSSQII